MRKILNLKLWWELRHYPVFARTPEIEAQGGHRVIRWRSQTPPVVRMTQPPLSTGTRTVY